MKGKEGTPKGNRRGCSTVLIAQARTPGQSVRVRVCVTFSTTSPIPLSLFKHDTSSRLPTCFRLVGRPPTSPRPFTCALFRRGRRRA